MFDIIGKKYYFFTLSILVVIAGVIGYIYHGGFNLDIQFQGGTVVEMNMTEKSIDKAEADAFVIDTSKAEEIIFKATGKEAAVQKAVAPDINAPGKSNVLMILNIAISEDTAVSNVKMEEIQQEIIKEYKLNPDTAISNVNNVEPFIGKEIMNNGLKAVAVSSILIILYIWWRFKIMSGLSAGIFAVLGLVHDILIMIAVYTVFNITLNESFIAAVLTIMGYSMNDTIIIYDRIRENSNLLRKVPIAELVNKSILQTLARSINTVVTVLISIITVYVFARIYGIKSIEEFSLPLIVGIASGCYSSIFIASPLWVMWKQNQANRKATGRLVKAKV